MFNLPWVTFTVTRNNCYRILTWRNQHNDQQVGVLHKLNFAVEIIIKHTKKSNIIIHNRIKKWPEVLTHLFSLLIKEWNNGLLLQRYTTLHLEKKRMIFCYCSANIIKQGGRDWLSGQHVGPTIRHSWVCVLLCHLLDLFPVVMSSNPQLTFMLYLDYLFENYLSGVPVN